MRVLRLTNPGGLEYLREHLQIDDDVSSDQSLEYLRNAMEIEPQSIQVLMAIEAPEEVPENDNPDLPSFELKAFSVTIAFPGRDHVLLQQAWSKMEPDHQIGNEMLLRIIQFADQWDRKSIRCETKRGNAVCRRWNFVEHAVVLKLDLPEDFAEKLLTRVGLTMKEPDNGYGRRRIKRNATDGSPSSSGLQHNELSPGQDKATGEELSGHSDREGGDSLRGGSGSPAFSGSPSG